jgi:membrane fusion protein
MAIMFREEARKARAGGPEPELVLLRPPHLGAYFGAAACLVAAVSWMLFFVTIPFSISVPGRIQPEGGVVVVRSPAAGRLEWRTVEVGDRIAAGQALASINTAVDPADVRIGSAAQLVEETNEVVAQLRVAIRRAAERFQDLQGTLEMRLAGLDDRAEAARARAAALEDRLHLAQSELARAEQMLQQGLLAPSLVDQKRILVAEAKTAYFEHRESLASIAEQKVEMRSEYEQRRHENEQYVSSLLQQQNEARRLQSQLGAEDSIAVAAPRAGVVASVFHVDGDSLERGEPLIKLLPEGARLLAELFVPASAAQGLDIGADVVVRVHAYPWFVFGFLRGKIIRVNQADSSTIEARESIDGDTSFRVLVAFDLPRAGRAQLLERLRPDLTIQADIVTSRQTLWNRILHPNQ